MTRKQCESEIYHITERGVGRQIIFEDNSDRRLFGETMTAVFQEENVSVFAWCFMDNHVHLLLHGTIENISRSMHRVNSSYARHFNNRHDRCGTLFQSRFHSVSIQSDAQFAAALRYIHFNPEEIAKGISAHYAWSSFREYLGGKSALGCIADKDRCLNLLGGQSAFDECHRAASADEPLLPPTEKESPADIAHRVLGRTNLYDVKQMPKDQRNETIRALHDEGLSIRQIERVTSIGRSIIARAIENVTK